MSDLEAREMDGVAERWWVRLQAPDCTEEERAACARWRAANPAHEAAFREAEGIWRESAELGDDPLIAAAVRAAERDKAPRRRYAWYWTLAWMAVGAAALAYLAVQMQMAPDAPAVHYQTQVGEQRRVVLPDGTAIVLDTGTELAVRYTDKRRLIDLSQGQAQFQVAHNPQRPFVVHADGGTVTDTGTQFDVRVQGPVATVTLLKGSVVVQGAADAAQPHPPITLSPGQRLHFDRTGRDWSVAPVDLASASAWTQGSLQVSDWPLGRLVAEMNRYSTTPMRLADPALADIRISGTFRTGDQDGLVLVLEHGWPVRAARRNGEIVLSRAPLARQ
jgi:transmembrane sensor